ncbi:DUF922 domain-containing protein [Yoonia sp. SS1-5]|uniref:DUF922 domain-containing protein n=1 Tax=Yoonia rhodophyticola TaxID=3137370 RepID=A0AAN0MFM8_9RHOB
MRIFRLVPFLILPLAAHAQAPLAADELIIKPYTISGSSLAEVEEQLNSKGPHGYWAWAQTRWRWDGNCNMSFRAEITMPRLEDPGRLTAAEQAEWDRMYAALLDHEMGHVTIGRDTALAIKAADCKVDSQAYDAEFRAAQKAYDARTNHGIDTGATLNY